MPATTGESLYRHVYNKSIDKLLIFSDKEDSDTFLNYIAEYLSPQKDIESTKKTFTVKGKIYSGTPHLPKNYFEKVELIAYSLKPNHFHLLVKENTEGSLERFLRSLSTRYSIYFNKKYNRTGSLFAGAYKAIVIKDEAALSYLTRFFHRTNGYSSYPEYLDTRQTSWLRPLKSEGNYKDFVEKYELDQKGVALLDGITFDGESDHLVSIKKTTLPVSAPIQTHSPAPTFHYMAAVGIFFLLLSVGIKNISASGSTNPSPSPSSVLSESTVAPTPTPSATEAPKTIITIKITDGSKSVNIRKSASVGSEKVGEATDGETFELVSIVSGWYEVVLSDGTNGFISPKYVERENSI